MTPFDISMLIMVSIMIGISAFLCYKIYKEARK